MLQLIMYSMENEYLLVLFKYYCFFFGFFFDEL